MEAQVDDLLLESVEDVLHFGKAELSSLLVKGRDRAHLNYDLLHDVVAVVVVAAIHQLAGEEESADKADLLVDADDLEGGLHDPAAVLVGREPVQVLLEALVDAVDEDTWHGSLTLLGLLGHFDLRCDPKLVDDLGVHLQDDLDHVVAEVVQDELGEVDCASGAEGPLEEALLLGFFYARVAEAPLDVPR